MGRHLMISTSDPEHWRSRAEEARAMADNLTGEDARQQMLTVARDYDLLALMMVRRQQRERERG